MSVEAKFDSRVYRQAATELRSKRHGMLQEFDGYIGGKIERGEDPLTSRFMMDGGAVVSFEEFEKLPIFLQDFFKDERMTMPSSVSVFQDYREGMDGGLGYVKQQTRHTELRGRRYWDYDGSKANHGPDEDYALQLLDENMSQNGVILEQLLEFKAKTEAEWLAKISAFEYIRNDFSAAYYLKKCEQALDPAMCDPEILKKYDATLEWVSDRYFSSILMIEDGARIQDVVEDFETVQSDLLRMDDFVTDERFRSRDLIRSHREVGNPFVLLHTIYAVYGESYLSGDEHLSVSTAFSDTDLVVCPLYGGLDGAMALRYIQKHGPNIVCEITGKTADSIDQNLQILPVLSKIGSRGVVRSSISEGEQVKTLTTDWEVDQVNVDSKLIDALVGSEKITTLDDSCATAGSEIKLKEWLVRIADKDFAFKHVVGYVNIRWAHRQGLNVNQLMERSAIAVTPIDRNMVQPKERRWSRYKPDSYMMENALRSNLTVTSMTEAKGRIEELYQSGVIEAVGFDHGETLVKRTVSQRERRDQINNAASKIFESFGVNLTPELFHKITKPVLDATRKVGETEYKEIDLLDTYKQMVGAVGIELGTSIEIDSIAQQLFESELNIERATTVANNGVVDLLEYLSENNIPMGIYSNTPYSADFMYELLEIAGISKYFKRENVLCSSDEGAVLKPNKGAVGNLAKKLNVQPKKMIFVGNTSNTDVSGAAKAGAIPLFYLFPGQYPKLEKRQENWRNFLGIDE